MVKILAKDRFTTGIAAIFAVACVPGSQTLGKPFPVRRRPYPCGPIVAVKPGPGPSPIRPRLVPMPPHSPYKPRFHSLLANPATRRYHSPMRGTKDGKPDTSDGTEGKPAAKPDAQPTREERLADALRENLKKRKAQTRARAARKPDQQTDET